MRRTSGLVFNRLSVERALTRASALWKRLAQKDYPNGFVIFCSDEVVEVVHPPKPLRRRVYNCGRHFATSVLHEAIEAGRGPVYGGIAIDGAEATFGKVQGLCSTSDAAPTVTKLGHLTSTTASRTRRGGQSALRYSRLRDEAELAFLRKVVEHAKSLFPDVRGIIVAGKADMKRKLLLELPEFMQKQVICSVDLPGAADLDGLRKAAFSATGAALSKEQDVVELAVQRFLELSVLASDGDGAQCCYGLSQTTVALRMGAVEELLVSKDFNTGDFTVADLKELANVHGASVLEIQPRSEKTVQFCKSFQVGARLRWAVPVDLLEEEMPHVGNEIVMNNDCSTDAITLHMAEAPTCTPTESCAHLQGDVISWLEAELGNSFDAASSQALATCVDVILSDDATPAEELVSQVEIVLLDEGVCEAVVSEFKFRWQAVLLTKLSLASIR